MISLPLTRGHVAIIDEADFERETTVGFRDGFEWTGRICDLKMHAAVKKHTVYAVTIRKGHELRLHRLVVGAAAGVLVDHRDHNGLNNVRANLRVTNAGGNASNRVVNGIGSTRFKGVAAHRSSGKFEAYIRHQNRKRHLGLFESDEEAARAYDLAALNLFGEFACLNFPLPGGPELVAWAVSRDREAG